MREGRRQMKWNKNELQWKKQEWKNACGGEKTKSGTLEMKEFPALIGSAFVFPEKWRGGHCCLGAQTVLNLCFGTSILSTFVATYPNMTTPIVIEKWLKSLPLHSTTKQNCYFHNKSYYSALSIAIAMIFKYSKSHQDFKKCNSLWDFF